ncbi:site-specific DNA-methyltransferase [Tenacibaculum singaporense]|uniref:site-specific DNA-methyltransferase (adenine-specific) n=1 Tax=Tenacibaculum singaporense TaxID=2358479 RepID=A0A3S8R9B2_9FLAO|nr:site-specific DNA-methyltransferase [Tenacibaculum singaporense]AZJ36391.1 site-specific DNA-methyltransferase [Tenacibaculum singaporense]
MSIDKIQQGDSLTQSKDLVADNIEKLKQLFPEIVTEGKIDFKVLQDVLGEDIEEEDEYYRLTWAGKAKARREAHKPSTGTLRPVKEDSVNWDTTENLYIEGDNLEVLKLLQKSYAGKVKMIYIDPPYNTGKDFVYKDNYKDNLKNYQEITGQLDEEGNKISTNSDSDGRYHSNWLNMMYPRLRLARNLLKDNGIIFISIDDVEVGNLRAIGNEIFGNDNFISNMVWQKNYSPRNDAKYFSDMHDHILVFAKNKDKFERILLPRTAEQNARYTNRDNDPRGDWKAENLSVKTYSAAYDYPITTPGGRVVNPPKGRCWRTSKEKMEELDKDNRIWWGEDGNNVPSKKSFLSEVQQGRVPTTLLFRNEVGDNQEAAKRIVELFDGKPFDTPKPIGLIKHFLSISTDKNDLVLDFFAGSSTTADSLFQKNLEDNGHRKFIQIQLPEPTNKKSEGFRTGYNNVSEISKERIRRAAKKIAEEHPEKAEKLDLGFKVFKLDNSNIKGWDGNPDKLEANLWDAVSNIKEDRTQEDVLYEILLKYGLDLTLPIEEKTIEGKIVFNVGFGALFICLGDNLTNTVAEGIGEWKEELEPEICRVIFKDTGFTDVEKTNSIQTLKRFGIGEIKSI